MYRRSIETRQDETNKEKGKKENYSAVGYVATDCDNKEEEEEVQLHAKETLNWSIEIKQRQREKEIDLVM